MPSLTVGVDEFTLVLQPIDKVKITEWPEVSEKMMSTFLIKSRLTDLYGPMEHSVKIQACYSSGVTFGNRPWHLTINWSEDMPTMGICVRYSAHAYAAYKAAYMAQFQAEMNIVDFLHMVQDGAYTTRLSRIDLTADYFNYTDEHIRTAPLSPDAIYTRLKDGNYIVKNGNGHQSIRSMSGVDKGGAYQTFYLGSQKGKTNGVLRCYDKKAEQLQTMGFRYDDALNCDSWVRFEAVYRHDYAHQITEGLLTVKTVQELSRLIAGYICGKYQFFDANTDEVTEFTADLLGVAAGSSVIALSSTSPRDNTLRQSIEHLRAGSGLYATLYKAYKVWGDGADRELLRYLYDDYICNFRVKLLTGQDKYKAKEIRLWLKQHEEETKQHPLNDYLDRSRHNLNLPLFDATGKPVVITMDGDDL
mgnify:CR=1 FL=1